MPADEIHIGDIGVQFLATIKDGSSVVNISTATTKQLNFRKPSGSILNKTASFYTNGTDGQIYYTSISGDLDECGTWSLQGYISMAGGTWSTDIYKFQVHRNIS